MVQSTQARGCVPQVLTCCSCCYACMESGTLTQVGPTVGCCCCRGSAMLLQWGYSSLVDAVQAWYDEVRQPLSHSSVTKHTAFALVVVAVASWFCCGKEHIVQTYAQLPTI
jgi:hypothetical protein